MATRGPKPTPLHLNLVRGNPGKRKLPDPAKMVNPPTEAPSAPPHLSEDARVEWDRIIGVLISLKMMTPMDRAPLAAYCEAYGRWVQAERTLRAMAEQDTVTHGLVIKTTGGNLIQNPMVGTANKAMGDMMKYAAEFGMTPSARARLQTADAASEENPFEAFRKSAT